MINDRIHKWWNEDWLNGIEMNRWNEKIRDLYSCQWEPVNGNGYPGGSQINSVGNIYQNSATCMIWILKDFNINPEGIQCKSLRISI